MDTRIALGILDDALQRCRKEDVRTPEVYAALEFLEARAVRKWPFNQFREALDTPGSEGWESEGRWQLLNASLNGIKFGVSPTTADRAELKNANDRKGSSRWLTEATRREKGMSPIFALVSRAPFRLGICFG